MGACVGYAGKAAASRTGSKSEPTLVYRGGREANVATDSTTSADKAPDANIGDCFWSFAGKIKSHRADSKRCLAPITSDRSAVAGGIAEACKSLISRWLSLLRVDACCTVLRSRWCQSGVSRSRILRL